MSRAGAPVVRVMIDRLVLERLDGVEDGIDGRRVAVALEAALTEHLATGGIPAALATGSCTVECLRGEAVTQSRGTSPAGIGTAVAAGLARILTGTARS